ncbi:hypothetical protein F01_310057 [Burkholderia cenocepacia]|nr:hypothetical protein F01_310057 [Burkholderia cenocepacia]
MFQQKTRPLSTGLCVFGSPTWARTRDLRINSPALYRLSYRGTNKQQQRNEIVWSVR